MSRIAYFSMEIALRSDIPTYSGGLGVLSGDTIKSAADLGIPMVAVSILYNRGYFKQSINHDGRQIATDDPYNPEKDMMMIDKEIQIPIQGRNVTVRPWLYEVKGINGHVVPVYLLDADTEKNPDYDGRLTHTLYNSAHEYFKVCQYAILGIGGVRLLNELGLSPEVYHLNEGHGALATIELARMLGREKAKEKTVFTTHTPVPAGHDCFPIDVIKDTLGRYIGNSLDQMVEHGRVNMTRVALEGSRYVNAVAKRHAEVSREMDVFRGREIDHITNGVHSMTWTSPEMQKVYDRYLHGWRNDPSKLAEADNLPLNAILDAQMKAKNHMIDNINEKIRTMNHGAVLFEPESLTLGIARRFATYKRPDLIFTDPNKLLDACKGKVQIVYAGKAHPNDGGGRDLIKRINLMAKDMKGKLRVVFLENYNMDLARMLVSGCDAWVNTPERGREASGTSGMKAAHNARPHLSIDDGWHPEAKGGVWTIGEPADSLAPIDNWRDAMSLYSLINDSVLPTFENPTEMAKMSRVAIKNSAFFNTHRMDLEYLEKAYKPSMKEESKTDAA